MSGEHLPAAVTVAAIVAIQIATIVTVGVCNGTIVLPQRTSTVIFVAIIGVGVMTVAAVAGYVYGKRRTMDGFDRRYAGP